MKILCYSYRDWANKIYENIENNTDHKVCIIHGVETLDQKLIEEFNPDYILFYGWSWIVPNYILDKYSCLMLHPSKLPKYRGGSPIQNQILDGVTESSVSIFAMVSEIDAGPILGQSYLSLSGSIEEIFQRLTDIGTSLTLEILREETKPQQQDHSLATYCERRSPEMSEITLEELMEKPAQYIYDKIRCLTGPYPRAYITCGDGKKYTSKVLHWKSLIN